MLERSGAGGLVEPTGPTADARQIACSILGRCADIRARLEELSCEATRSDASLQIQRAVHALAGIVGIAGYLPLSVATIRLRDDLSALLQTQRTPTTAERQALEEAVGTIEKLSQAPEGEGEPSPEPSAPHREVPRIGAPRVFLVEDDDEQAEALSESLRAAGYSARVFDDLDAFHASVQAERPDAVIVDMMLQEGDEAGALAIARLQQSAASDIPAIVVSARDDLPARLAALRAGACRYLTKPVDTGYLVEQLDIVTERQPAEPYRILMVDDEPLSLELHGALLESAGMDVRTLSDPLKVIDALEAHRPDVLLLDQSMPGASGPELAAVLRERDVYRHIPILFLSAETDSTRQLTALSLGGDDFLVKPVDPRYLVAAVTARARRARENRNATERLRSILYDRERVRLALDRHAIVSVADRNGAITT